MKLRLMLKDMISELWLEFLIGVPGFKRQESISTVFSLLELTYPDKWHKVEIIGGQKEIVVTNNYIICVNCTIKKQMQTKEI